MMAMNILFHHHVIPFVLRVVNVIFQNASKKY